MANGHGGERTPRNPAAVSGPGAMSQRTDGGPATQGQMIAPGNGYGERAQMEQIQGGAPMQGGGGGDTAPPPPTPLGAPSARPDEPVTAGAEVGPGLSAEQAGILSDDAATMEQLKPLLRSLELVANLPGSTPQFRSFVRKAKAKASGNQNF